ncbi:MobA/MobL family protein [Castellaniella sp.]|uniref:MobA/MobL family protein n=1 Tax=Castellaniella sp. TaxID=1955812 RepID=UPI002B003E2E|nr:MobA/MobL family protein [Castellaniella sp.]
MAVDFAIHAPDRFGDQRNAHAHLLVTTRVIEQDGTLGKKATIELANKDRQKLGIPGTSQGDITEMRAEAAGLINRALELADHETRVDHRSYEKQSVDLTPTRHLGRAAVVLERRGIVTERLDLHQEDRARQRTEILTRPEIILDKITVQSAVFSRHAMAEELNRYIDDPQEFQNLLARLEMSPELVTLEAGRDGRGARYSTREMIAVESRMIATAQHMTDSTGRGARERIVAAAIAGVGTLSAEQETAVRHHRSGPSVRCHW